VIVDDDAASCRTLQLHLHLHLQSLGHQVETALSLDQGLALQRRIAPELVILDIRMPGKSGLQGLPEFKAADPQMHVIMITALHDMESTIQAMQLGAEDYIHKPIDIDELEAAIHKILTVSRDKRNLVMAPPPENGTDPLTMVGRSRAMKEIFKTIGLVAKSPATVLISGESGTGKELVARAIHRAGEHPQGPFTDARVIAATNRELTERVRSGAFREDLFYRLQVVNIHLPPLRERKEDLLDLVHTLLGRINRELHRNVTRIAQGVLDCLQGYHWPGNVRELENVLMKSVALSSADTLTPDLLPPEIARGAEPRTAENALQPPEQPLEQQSLQQVERTHVARVLKATAWHKGQTCQILGVSRPRLRRMIRQYGLEPPEDATEEFGEESR